MARIRLEDVRKEFVPGGLAQVPGLRRERSEQDRVPRIALDGVNLVVHHRETLTVLGPSGCGKTTLLRVVAGLIPHKGHVYFDDQLMDDVKPSERKLGMVFQNYALYPHFDGFDNLRFTFLTRRRPSLEAEERIRITSDLMGIGFDELLRHKPGKLSGGEQQRVAVGRALVRNPDLFLFDEPLSSLDAKLRVRTRAEIKRLLKRFGHTAIYVTHDQTEAIAIGDRLAIMRAGRVEQTGTHTTLYNQPINTFVAGFLGSPAMTLIRGTLNDDGAWQCGDLAIPLPNSVISQLYVGSSLILGIRPEHVCLAADEPPTLTGRVTHIERDLPRRVQTLFVTRDDIPDIAMTIPSTVWIRLGDTVPAVFAVDKLVFFDGKTEKRIG